MDPQQRAGRRFPLCTQPLYDGSLLVSTTRNLFAWLPAVHQGEGSVVLDIRGKKEHLKGVGYHDHNFKGSRTLAKGGS